MNELMESVYYTVRTDSLYTAVEPKSVLRAEFSLDVLHLINKMYASEAVSCTVEPYCVP
jgi:hypothetical protein